MGALSEKIDFPEGWNARSRCVPDPDDIIQDVDDELDKARTRLTQKCAKINRRTGAPSIVIPPASWNDSPFKSAMNGWKKAHPGAVSEKSIREARKALKLHVFAATPVDKYSADGRLM